jgi:hypothetical protein
MKLDLITEIAVLLGLGEEEVRRREERERERRREPPRATACSCPFYTTMYRIVILVIWGY